MLLLHRAESIISFLLDNSSIYPLNPNYYSQLILLILFFYFHKNHISIICSKKRKAFSCLVCTSYSVACAFGFIEIASITGTTIACIFDLQLDSIKIKYFSYRSLHDHLLFGFTYDSANLFANSGVNSSCSSIILIKASRPIIR